MPLSILDMPVEIIIYCILPWLDCKSCIDFSSSHKSLRFILSDITMNRFDLDTLLNYRVIHNLQDCFESVKTKIKLKDTLTDVFITMKEYEENKHKYIHNDKPEMLRDYKNVIIEKGWYPYQQPVIKDGILVRFECHTLLSLTGDKPDTYSYIITSKGNKLINNGFDLHIEIVKKEDFIDNRECTTIEQFLQDDIYTKPFVNLDKPKNEDYLGYRNADGSMGLSTV